MNLLPLDTWRQLMAFHPWHFWGLADTDKLRVSSACNGLVTEYGWQATDAASRSDIREAIATAEQRLLDYLRYAVAPRYVEATVPWPTYLDAMYHRHLAIGGDGRRLTVQLPEGQIQAIGVEQLTAEALAQAVTPSDPDGDGYDEQFRVGPIATTITDASQIAVYVAAGDRFDGPDFTSAVGDRWRIQPITITISGGMLTITGARWLLVPPIQYQGLTGIGSGLNPAAAAVTTLDIYQRTTDTNGTTTDTSQATIVWDTDLNCCDGATALGSPFDPAATGSAVGRVGLVDASNGIVAPAASAYDAGTGVWSSFDWTMCSEPARVIIRYLAGYPLASDGQMNRTWQVIVARLAAAELARPICACDEANRELYRWQFDLARTSGAGDEAYGAVSQEDLANPFGTRRGHVYAWRQVKNLRQLRGILP